MSIVSKAKDTPSQSPFGQLPLELWGVVASFAQTSSLHALSLTSKDHKEFALKARVQTVFHEKLKEFQQAMSLEVKPLSNTPSHLNTYFDIINRLNENNLFPGNSQEKSLLQKKLTACLTSSVEQEVLRKKAHLNKLIRKHLLSWQEIDQFGEIFQMRYLIGSLVFLTKSSTDKKRSIELIISGAARQGDHLLFQQMIGKNTLNEPFRGYILKKASEKGHIKIVKIILEKGSISAHDLKIALRWGLFHKRLDFVKTLMPHVHLDPNELSSVILYAIQSKSFDISQHLGYDKLNSQMRARALAYATKYGNIKLAETILESGDTEATERAVAVKVAASMGRFDMIRLILEKCRIDPLHRQEVAAILTKYLPS